MADKAARMIYLRPGQAVVGLPVAKECGKVLYVGHIAEITESPKRKVPRRRRCTVRCYGGGLLRAWEGELFG